MNTQAYIQYFRNIATNLIAIGHTPSNPKFTRINIEEVLNGVRANLNMATPVMVLENYEARFTDRKTDNVFKDLYGAFMVVKNVRMDDFEAEAAALDLTESIIMKVLAKMKADKDSSIVVEMRGFDLSTVVLQKIGGIFDNAYGYRAEFTLRASVPLVIDPADWL